MKVHTYELIQYLKKEKGAASLKLANEAIIMLISIIEDLEKQVHS